MRILLNLLPENEKRTLTARFRFRFFTWQTTLLLLLGIFYLTVLGGIYFLLDQRLTLAQSSRDTLEEANTESQKLTLYQESFKEANTVATLTDRYAKNHLRWTNLFVLLERLTPEGVVIVDLSTADYTVTLSGQARTRENFLAFEDKLKDAECVSDVKVPISNLFSQKELEFQVMFNMRRDCLLSSFDLERL